MKINMYQRKFNTKFNLSIIWIGFLVTSVSLILQFAISFLSSFQPDPNYPPVSNPHNLWYPTSIFTGIWIAISTFTIQSNILAAVFFAVLLFYFLKKKPRNLAASRYGLALTIYINITMIIFFVALFKPMLEKLKTGNIIDLITFSNTFCLHLITPFLVTLFFLVNTGSEHWYFKDSMKRSFPLTIGYMLLYLAYVLIKGTFVGQLYLDKVNKTQEIRYSYPYPFLNFKTNPGEFTAYFFIILGLFIILYFGFILYNNVRNERMALTKQQ